VQRLQPPSFQKEKKKVTDISALDLQFADWPDVFFHMSVGQEKNKNNLQQTNKQNKTTTKQQPTMSSSKNQSTKTPATSAKSTSRHSAAQAAALVSGGHNLRSSSRGGAAAEAAAGSSSRRSRKKRPLDVIHKRKCTRKRKRDASAVAMSPTSAQALVAGDNQPLSAVNIAASVAAPPLAVAAPAPLITAPVASSVVPSLGPVPTSSSVMMAAPVAASVAPPATGVSDVVQLPQQLYDVTGRSPVAPEYVVTQNHMSAREGWSDAHHDELALVLLNWNEQDNPPFTGLPIGKDERELFTAFFNVSISHFAEDAGDISLLRHARGEESMKKKLRQLQTRIKNAKPSGSNFMPSHLVVIQRLSNERMNGSSVSVGSSVSAASYNQMLQERKNMPATNDPYEMLANNEFDETLVTPASKRRKFSSPSTRGAGKGKSQAPHPAHSAAKRKQMVALRAAAFQEQNRKRAPKSRMKSEQSSSSLSLSSSTSSSSSSSSSSSLSSSPSFENDLHTAIMQSIRLQAEDLKDRREQRAHDLRMAQLQGRYQDLTTYRSSSSPKGVVFDLTKTSSDDSDSDCLLGYSSDEDESILDD
jgi:hypothetical protein